MIDPANSPTEPMVRTALDYLDYLRVSCRIDLNYYIDERVITEVYQRMEAVRARSARSQNQR